MTSQPNGSQQEKTEDPLRDVAILIKTFLRPLCLKRLVDSVLTHYPAAQIHIADDGPQNYGTQAYYDQIKKQGCQVHMLPFDVGLSVGRNFLVDHTSRPYLLILDDDFVFTPRTRIETFVEVMHGAPELGVVGGALAEDGTKIRHYEYTLYIKNHILHYTKLHNPPRMIAGHQYHDADIVLNFALFRRKVFDSVRWDNALKTEEHTDFYLRFAQTTWKAVYTPSVIVDHYHETTPIYTAFRHRPLAIDAFLDKWDLAASHHHRDEPRKKRRKKLYRTYFEAADRAERRGRPGERVKWVWKALGQKPYKTRAWRELGVALQELRCHRRRQRRKAASAAS